MAGGPIKGNENPSTRLLISGVKRTRPTKHEVPLDGWSF